MKFLVFNIVVAGALIYLFTNQGNRVEFTIPRLNDVKAAAEQVLDRDRAPQRQTPSTAPAPKPANPFSIIDDTEVAAATPAVDAPVIDADDLVPPYLGTQVAAAPVIDDADLTPRTAEAPVAAPAGPLDPAVAQRRAEVLGDGPASSFAPAQPVQASGDRRRQLLDLAEEMEYLAAEFSVQ